MNASSIDPSRSDCDVVVLGGGPAGAAAAITLARGGHSVAVLEKSHYEEPRIGETLPPSARLPLADLGVWESFLSAGHLPAPGVASAWGEDELYETHFIFNPHGRGWHLDRQRFDAMLAQAASDAGALLYCDARIASCLPVAGGWEIDVISGVGIHRWRQRPARATGDRRHRKGRHRGASAGGDADQCRSACRPGRHAPLPS